MTKTALLLLTAVLSVMLLLSAAPVSAQQPDIDSMTDQEILVLLQSILQKLEQDGSSPETPETAPSEPTPGPVAVKEPETTQETEIFQIYENKKLIIEALPSYMFIRPEKKEKEPEVTDTDDGNNGGSSHDDHDSGGDDGTCPPITPCVPGSDDYCEQWVTPEGKCVCMC